MDLVSEIPDRHWKVSDTATLTYRPAESLDEDIARLTAKEWWAAIVKGESIREDLAINLPSKEQLIAEISDPSSEDQPLLSFLFLIALALRCVTKVEGFTLNGVPATHGRAFYGHLFRDTSLKSAWRERVYAPLNEAHAAGNV